MTDVRRIRGARTPDMRPRVLIAGGGIAAAEAALALHAFAGGRARIEILAPAADTALAPASTVAAFNGGQTATLPLAQIARRAGATLRRGALGAVDVAARTALTANGKKIAFHALVVAVGARRVPCFDATALTFRGSDDVAAFQRLLDAVEIGALHGVRTHLALVVPPGPGWPLPAYELALQAAGHLERAGLREGIDIAVVTSEDAPLAAFGPQASEAVRRDLAAAGIALATSATVRSWGMGRLHLVTGASVPADRVVALPAARGPAIPGLPCDSLGFVRTDDAGRVEGTEGIFAVGDAGTFPVKQGGIGCQQADTAASLVAIGLGAAMEPVPFAPVLRGILVTDHGRRFLRAELAGGRDESVGVSATHDPLWWPPEKVAGRFLAPALSGMEAGCELVDQPGFPPTPD